MAGKVIFQTGSFLGEMGTTAGGEIFVNSFGKAKGVVVDGAERVSSSADGSIIERQFIDTVTGEVLGTRTVKIDSNNVTQNFFSGSSGVDANRIQFIQKNNAGAPVGLIHISGSDVSGIGVNFDAISQDRLLRPNRDMFVTSNAAVFSVGLSTGSSGVGYEISNTIAFGGSGRRLFIEDNSHHSSNRIHLSGSVVVSGSLELNGSAVGSGGGGGAIATYNSSGDNRVITSVDSDTVQGEENLTFDGSTLNVNGTLSATRKSFDIQHPSKPDKRLVYGSLEGPEFGVYIRGKVEGDNKIEMPDYWVDLVDMNTLSVHLTPINSEKAIYFTFSDNKYIYINREAHFFYMICAERKDIDRLQVEQ